jgi:hypothetical protein
VRGQRYQLDWQHGALSLVRRKVIVRTLRDGSVLLVHRGKKLKWRALPGRPARVSRVASDPGGCGLWTGDCGLGSFRFAGNDLARYMVGAFPAILLLAGDDEDLLAGLGLAVAGDV